MLACAARHLRPGGVFATTLMDLEGELLDDEYGPPPPDMREVDRWVYSSLSAAAHVVERGSALRIERLRTAVSPEGEESTSVDEVRLELVSPDELEAEAAAGGLTRGGAAHDPRDRARRHASWWSPRGRRRRCDARRDLARPRVRLLRGRPAALGGAGRRRCVGARPRCGTGRVAMHLARRGRKMTARRMGRDARSEVLEERAAERGLDVEVVCADVRDFKLDREFDVVLAPMQLVQLMRGAERAARDARARGAAPAPGRTVRSRADGPRGRGGRRRVRPSHSRHARGRGAGCTRASRWRSAPCTAARRSCSTACGPPCPRAASSRRASRACGSSSWRPEALEREMQAAGWRCSQRRVIPPTEEHVGSVVVVGARPEARVSAARPARHVAVPGPHEHLRRPRQHLGAGASLPLARHRLRAGHRGPGRRGRPRCARPLLHGRRPGPRPGAGHARPRRDEARVARGGRRFRRFVPGGVRRLPAARPLIRAARRRVAARPRPRRPAHRARARRAADRQRADRGRPRQRARSASPASRTTAAARTSATASSRSAAWCRGSATTARTAPRACAAAS